MNRILIVTLVWAALLAVGNRAAHSAEPQRLKSLVPSDQALAGWIALFDGDSIFGFRDAKIQVVEKKVFLQGGTTTTEFSDFELKIKVAQEGILGLGGEQVPIQPGEQSFTSRGRRGPISLSADALVESLIIRPLDLKPLWNGRDLTGWDRRGRVPAADKAAARWTVEHGAIRVVGGPEALEYAPSEDRNLFGDFIAQLVVRTRRPGANGGFFFRNQPGKTMMGYEAQLHNTWYDPLSGKHGYTTGGIDDRQQARVPIAVDDVPFRMTVIADGPHIATWVNGYQTADWVDTRPADPNPRQGLRVEPGTIQLQAHDPDTDLEFQGIWLQELK